MKNELDRFYRIANKWIEAEEHTPISPPVKAENAVEELGLALNDSPISDEEFEQILTGLVLASPKTTSKKFFNLLFGGRTEKSAVADMLVSLMNNTMHTYKASGPMVSVEHEIIRSLRPIIGYDTDAWGTMAEGGSMAIFMAMLMARDHHDQEIKREGVNKKYTLYTSEESHYSIPKNAAFMGVGREQVRFIPTLAGKMRVDVLEEKIKEDLEAGHSPFLVVGTAGTTVLGAFDPFEEIAGVAKKYGIWFHIDGAYCGTVMFSSKYRHLINGVEESDSFNFNGHKMLSTPTTCSVILTKHKKQLYQTFDNAASYLYQTDMEDLNLGKISLQCGRRNNALKLWALWKSVGTEGLGKIVEHHYESAAAARNYIHSNSDYKLFSYEPSVNVCFTYKDIPADELCNRLYAAGHSLVSFGIIKGQTFVRFVTVNGSASEEDVLQFFKGLEEFVEKEYALSPSA